VGTDYSGNGKVQCGCNYNGNGKVQWERIIVGTEKYSAAENPKTPNANNFNDLRTPIDHVEITFGTENYNRTVLTVWLDYSGNGKLQRDCTYHVVVITVGAENPKRQ
jgi:hypothetical protein